MKKKTIILALISMFVMFASNISAETSMSNDKEMPTPEKAYDVVEVMPNFPGGITKLMDFQKSNVAYPKIAMKKGIQGRVLVKFIVEKDGSITNVQAVKRVNPTLDNEAIRVVKMMPKWTPGKIKGEAVRVKFNVPIEFRLK